MKSEVREACIIIYKALYGIWNMSTAPKPLPSPNPHQFIHNRVYCCIGELLRKLESGPVLGWPLFFQTKHKGPKRSFLNYRRKSLVSEPACLIPTSAPKGKNSILWSFQHKLTVQFKSYQAKPLFIIINCKLEKHIHF